MPLWWLATCCHSERPCIVRLVQRSQGTAGAVCEWGYEGRERWWHLWLFGSEFSRVRSVLVCTTFQRLGTPMLGISRLGVAGIILAVFCFCIPVWVLSCAGRDVLVAVAWL